MAGSSAGYATRLVGLAAPPPRASAPRPTAGNGPFSPADGGTAASRRPCSNGWSCCSILLSPSRFGRRGCGSSPPRAIILGLAILSVSASRLSSRPAGRCRPGGPPRIAGPSQGLFRSPVRGKPRVATPKRTQLPYILPVAPSKPFRTDRSRSSIPDSPRAYAPGSSSRLDDLRRTGRRSPAREGQLGREKTWKHQVLSRRDGERGSSLMSTARNVPVDRTDAGRLTEWLMIEPAPDQMVTLRNLRRHLVSDHRVPFVCHPGITTDSRGLLPKWQNCHSPSYGLAVR